jgi:RimJ/RimL family protein N-acetyltransferase
MSGFPPAYEIRTARLVIRCKQPSDAPLLKQAMDSSLDHLRQWMPWAMHEPSELWVIEERIARFQRDFLSGEDRTYGIFNLAQTEILGGIGLHPTHNPGTMELGYWLRSDATGRGFAKEATAALAHAAFAQLGARRIEIRCDPRNLRSTRVPERLGFRLEQILIADTLTPTGEPRDTMVWAISAEEFAEKANLSA